MGLHYAATLCVSSKGLASCVNRSIKIILMLYAALAATACIALPAKDRFVNLPTLPVSVWSHLQTQAVVNARTGGIRFVARLNEVASTSSADTVWINRLDDALVCQCSALGDHEYLISEEPITDESGVYVSFNDESYKAVLEMVPYPMDAPVYSSVALSELAYVYNGTALADFLFVKGFQMELHSGMMNSSEYPGFRDTEYFMARDAAHRYLSIRGTSGARDIETTVDAALVPYKNLGLVHKGYLEVARHIFTRVYPALADSSLPIVVTGHSLGGSVAILVSMLLTDAGVPVTNLNFAPVPMADRKVALHYADLLPITNYFLPNEELAGLSGYGQLLWLPGDRVELPYVGTTAGAAHFVINYLKSVLVEGGRSRANYEAALPNCVLEKYACFDGKKENFVSSCAFVADDCFESQRQLLLGHPADDELNDESVDQMISDAARMLVSEPLTEHHQRVLRYRLAYLLQLSGDNMAAQRLLEGTQAAEAGFAGFLRARAREYGASGGE